MSFRTKRIIFITPFYMLFEFFLLKYILLLVSNVSDEFTLILTLFIGVIHLIPMFFEAKKSRKFTRFLSTIDGIWMWASVLFLIDILIIYGISQFIDLSFEIKLIFLAIVPILGAYNYYNAHNLVIREKIIKFDNLENEINIAHLSDIHFGSVRHKQIIEDIAVKLTNLEDVCDLVIISGDLADGSSVVEKDDFKALKKVNIPIIFTPGNHDFYPGIESVIQACENAGIVVLDNESFEFKCLNIFGLTFSFSNSTAPKVNKSLIKQDKINIINYHVPYCWEEFSKIGFDIQLSGHTHGGQFYPVVFFADLMFKYNKGLFKNKFGKYIHITTGVGSMDTPMRWGTNSEIVVLKLKKT